MTDELHNTFNVTNKRNSKCFLPAYILMSCLYSCILLFGIERCFYSSIHESYRPDLRATSRAALFYCMTFSCILSFGQVHRTLRPAKWQVPSYKGIKQRVGISLILRVFSHKNGKTHTWFFSQWLKQQPEKTISLYLRTEKKSLLSLIFGTLAPCFVFCPDFSSDRVSLPESLCTAARFF